MSSQPPIHLGFEVRGAKPVAIPLGHLVVFGQTQLSGKTTTLESLISRARVKAVAFVTKRGEGGFSDAHEIPPYLVERADWQSVQAILESATQTKQDFKQAWIMRACEGANTLADVQRNTKRLLKDSKGGFNQDMYYVLDHYFDIVIPQIRSLPRSDTVKLSRGLNVMSLDGYSPELQALVIRSVIEWVHGKEEGVVTVIPEAWRFLPQGRRSPVKLAAEQLVREGAGLRNFIWIDSQDIAGVDKLPVRAAKVWLIGVQREKNEVKRNLDNIPDAIAKPSRADVAKLELGQFYACWGSHVVKTYVQPVWMSDEDAKAIAAGKMSIEDAARPKSAARRAAQAVGGLAEIAAANPPTPAKPAKPTHPPTGAERMSLEEKMDRILQFMTLGARAQAAVNDATAPPPASTSADASGTPVGAFDDPDEEERYQRFKRRLIAEAPATLQVIQQLPELEIARVNHKVAVDGESTLGRLASLVHAGKVDEVTQFSTILRELERTGKRLNNKTLSEALKQLVRKGFLTKEGKEGYRAVPGMKRNITTKEA